jgi:hypothetical protein
MRQECADLALHHVDMMFHIFALKGFPVGLDAAAKAMSTQRKTEGVHGDLAPQMWRDKKYQEVIEYVGQDVRSTLDLCLRCEADKRFRWITKAGYAKEIALPRGWMTVEEALKFPLPDVSWMEKPWPREKLMGWING